MSWRFHALPTSTRTIHNHGNRRGVPLRKNGGHRSLTLEPLEKRLMLSATPLDTAQLVNISDLEKVTVDFSGMVYNRRTDKVTLNAAVTNSSSDTMPGTLYFVIDSGASLDAQFANADGQTLDGRPYYVLEQRTDDATAAFTPGETLAAEQLVLANAGRSRIDLSASVYALPTEMTLHQGSSSLSIPLGQTGYVAFGISTLQVDGHGVDIEFSQSIAPDNGGITVTSDYPPGGWLNIEDTTRVINHRIEATTVGSYTITSTATIPSLGISQSSELLVTVYDPGVEVAVLWEPGAEPDGLAVGTTTDVKFSALLSGAVGFPELLLEQVTAEGTSIGTLGSLRDDGLEDDSVAGDGVYTGTFPITTTEEGTLYFRSTVTVGTMTFASPLTTIEVTPFPVGVAPSDAERLVEDPSVGEQLYANELLVGIVEGTPSERIREIVDSLGGTIIGSIPSLNLLQVQIPTDGTAAGVAAAIAQFENYPEIEYAEPHYLGTLTAVSPDSSTQYGPVKIRADEAWVMSQGNLIVAVVDSGVDYNHPDLAGRVIKGKDYLDNDNDPMDDHGHGTHVAGIVGAKHDGSGISGISAGKILAIRIGGQAAGPSNLRAASGIRYAVDNGAKVINMSFKVAHSKALENAVKYANEKGALLVAAAGNDSSSDTVYPAGYAGVFVVGATDANDARAGFSNFGAAVHIAAPGTGIYSTMPNGGYASLSGTSMAAPHVAGAAAVLWNQHPTWSAAQVRQRLEQTAAPLASGAQLGAGRLDLFEAVFNGSFEIDTQEWQTEGTVSSLPSLGPIVPQHRNQVGYASTGPAGDQVAAKLEKTFTIQPGVTQLPIEFLYAFVTEEYPEWVGSVYDDGLQVSLIGPGGLVTELATEAVNTSTFYPISGIDFPSGDDTVGWTGWKTASATVPVTAGGQYTLRFEVNDAGDDFYDTALLVDRIRLKVGGTAPTAVGPTLAGPGVSAPAPLTGLAATAVDELFGHDFDAEHAFAEPALPLQAGSPAAAPLVLGSGSPAAPPRSRTAPLDTSLTSEVPLVSSDASTLDVLQSRPRSR